MEIESRLDRIERIVSEAPTQILDITRFHDKTLEFLKDSSLLKSESPICNNCTNQMSLMHNKNKADRFQYRCRSCNIAKTIRYNSIFEGSRLTLIEFTRLMLYYFIEGYSIQETHEETANNY